MKIGIWEGEDKREVEMKLFLENGYDSIDLMGIDAYGSRWTIAQISESGISMANSIAISTGWPLDSEGRLKLVD